MASTMKDGHLANAGPWIRYLSSFPIGKVKAYRRLRYRNDQGALLHFFSSPSSSSSTTRFLPKKRQIISMAITTQRKEIKVGTEYLKTLKRHELLGLAKVSVSSGLRE